jgi:hypothetical protein
MSGQQKEKKVPVSVEIDFGNLGLELDKSKGAPNSQDPEMGGVPKPHAAEMIESTSGAGPSAFELPELELSVLANPQTRADAPVAPAAATVVPQEKQPSLPTFDLARPEPSHQSSGFTELVKETFRPVDEVKAAFGGVATAGEGDTAFVENPAVPEISPMGNVAPTAVPSAMPLSMPPPFSAPLNGSNLSEPAAGTSVGTNQATTPGVFSGVAPTINLSDIVAAHLESGAANPAQPMEFRPPADAPPVNLSMPAVREQPLSASLQAPPSVVASAQDLPRTAVPDFGGTGAAMPPPAYSAFSLAAEPAPKAAFKGVPKPMLAGLAALLVVGAGYFFFGDEIAALISGSPQEEMGVPGATSPEIPASMTGNGKPVSDQASRKAGGAAKQGEVAGKGGVPTAVVQVSPKSFLSSKNRKYFALVSNAIERGEPSGAIRAFRTPLQVPLAKEDKIIAAEMEARYYLLVGNMEKAVNSLAPHCTNPMAGQFSSCVHYLRALISSKRFAEAKKLLEWSSRTPGLEAFKLQQVVLGLGLRALSVPMVDMSRALLTNAISELNVSSEWHRQRIVWFARSFLNLKSRDRESLLNSVLVSRRESTLNAFKMLERTALGVNEGLLLNFLDYWATRFEIKPISDVGPESRFDSDYARVGRIFSLLVREYKENYQTIGTSLVGFVGRPVFEELSSLVVANMAINDGNVQKAWNVLRREFEGVRSRKAGFGYEWALVFARCAVMEKGTQNLIAAKKELELAEKSAELAKGDFFYWLLKARLERETQTRNEESFNEARKLAYGPYENGLVVVEEARRLRAAGKLKEAAMLLHNSVSTIPDHGVLLQVAAEITPLIGLSPQKYLEAFSRIPNNRLMRNSEIPTLSEETMRLLFESI